MSYQALARQFRPQDFTELVGQEHVSQALINGLEQGRVHHAFLFTGTRGVGKTTVARILAKALNCEKGVTGSPCGTCTACTEISEGRFVDLVEVDAASRTGVDDTRELLENVQYAPTSGRYKIYLIDEVHMFSNSSFNALLKTLEEPPPHVKFLLATTEPKKLPVTVLSRCLQFNLKRLSLKQIKDHLQKLLTIQSITFDNNAIELIARAADGSMRDGLSLLDQSLAFGAGTVKEGDVKLMLGTMDQNSVVGLLQAIIAKDAQALTTQLLQIFEMSPDYAKFLDEMALLLHQVSLFQILNNYVEGSQFDRVTIKSIVASTNPEQVQLYYQIVIKGQQEILLAPDSKTGFEMTIIRMFAFKFGNPEKSNKTTPAIANTQLQQSQAGPRTTNAQVAQSSPISNSNVDNVLSSQEVKSETVTNAPSVISQNKMSLADITTGNWENIFPQLQLKGTARELARNAHVISNSQSVLTLAIDKQAHAFLTENAQSKLKTAIQNLVTEKISIQLEQDIEVQSTIARSEQTKIESNVRETKEKVEQNPFIKHMQQNFDAEVIQIKQGENFI